MRKFLRVFLVVGLSVFMVTSVVIAVVFLTPSKIELDPKKLIISSDFINFYDDRNSLMSVSDGKTYKDSDAEYKDIIKKAFIAVEDKNFYNHKGLDYKRMVKALFVNLKSFSFKQGASTISQQLIKNTHLSSEKTISRKITEIKLVKKLEKNYTKDQIITMYLNTIYFGENCFGLYNASHHYFNLSPNDLSIAEIATLAGIISAPSRLNPNADYEACLKKRNNVIIKMREQNYINEEEKNIALNEELQVAIPSSDHATPYLKASIDEIETLGLSPYSLKNSKVLTYYNEDIQKEISSYKGDSDYQAIILDNQTAGITAYYSTVGEISREIASCGKPLYVYAPAIEENYITEYTKILDEPVDFGGYKPKNYGDKYYGNVTVKEALSKSLNVPAVKILDSIGIKRAKNYAKKLNIDIENEGLSAALGNIGKGVKLKDLAAGYTTLANSGLYKKPHFIKQITDFKGNVIYKSENLTEKVFSPSTASSVTDALVDCAKSGTAKKLSYLKFSVAAKTGTYGTENGNYDCYSVGYTTDNTVAVWLGNKDNTPLPQKETGSNTPTYLLGKYFEILYKDKYPKDFSFNDLAEVYVDKISYENDGEIILADDNAPEKYKLKLRFKRDFLPENKSKRFSDFTGYEIQTTLNGNTVKFDFSLPDYLSVDIYKISDGQKELIYSGFSAFEDELTKEGLFEYYAVFHIDGIKRIDCEPIKLKSVKLTKENVGGKPADIPDEWWLD